MRRRKPAASTPAAALSLLVAVGAPCGRLCSHAAAAAFHQAASWSRSQAGRPARPGPRQTWRQASARGPETGDPEREETAHWEMVTAPLLPRRRAGWSILFLFRRWPRSQRYPKLNLRAVSSVSGSREGESCELCITGSLPSSSLARQQVVAQEHPSCPFVEPGKGGSTPVPASSRHTSGCQRVPRAYEAQGVPCPLRLRAHSTRGVASSWALARGASLADICRAAGWATPNTFARFYSLRVEPVSSCVLTSNG